jgi:hypothetical protein
VSESVNERVKVPEVGPIASEVAMLAWRCVCVSESECEYVSVWFARR